GLSAAAAERELFTPERQSHVLLLEAVCRARLALHGQLDDLPHSALQLGAVVGAGELVGVAAVADVADGQGQREESEVHRSRHLSRSAVQGFTRFRMRTMTASSPPKPAGRFCFPIAIFSVSFSRV